MRLMLQGKVSAALRWVGSQRSGLLEANDSVLNILKAKHPEPGRIYDDALLKGPAVEVEDVIFDAIDADLIKRTARSTSGGAGPSGADAEIWQRILCSKRQNLCRLTLYYVDTSPHNVRCKRGP